MFLMVLGFFYYFFYNKFAYWRVRGVPFVKPSIPIGNFKGVGSNKHLAFAMQEFYKKLKGKFPYGGVYMFTIPMVIVTDLNLIENILTNNFSNFTEHGLYSNEEDDPLSYNLFSMEGSRWKKLRTKLSPTFSSGKMKVMFPTMADVVGPLNDCVRRAVEQNSEVEFKDIAKRYTIDVIGNCVFGIASNSLENPNSTVREMVRRMFDEPRLKGYQLYLLFAFHDFAKKLGIKMVRDDVASFFTKIVERTIESRENSDIKRNDFMDLLLQLKNKGKLDDDELAYYSENGLLSTQEIISHSFVFFAAGFETSSNTIIFAMHELVQNQEMQEMLREEINNVLLKHNGSITYDAIMEMKLLERIIYETLRKYPIGPLLTRIVNSDYFVPGTKTVLQKGLQIFIPVYGIHHDPEYYPEPEKFDPDRFKTDVSQKRHPMTFLSFGDGPRACIGQRFGLMQAKLNLIVLIKNYKWTPTNKTVFPIKFDLSSISVLLSPVGGVYFNAKQI